MKIIFQKEKNYLTFIVRFVMVNKGDGQGTLVKREKFLGVPSLR